MLVWFLLASSHAAGSLLIDLATSRVWTPRLDLMATLLAVTLAQTAMLQSLLRFFRSKPHENPDQHG